jgi:hypothetical protein
MEKLPTDVIFLLLGACPPPDYVNLAVALCHVIFRHEARRLWLSAEKRVEWQNIRYEYCVQRWQAIILERHPRWDNSYALSCAIVLTTRKFDPDVDDLPDIATILYFMVLK